MDVIPGGEWLPLPDIVEQTGVSLSAVRQWLNDRELVGVRRGANNALMVPSTFLAGGAPLASLHGTITVLADGGFSDEEIVDWLHREDDTLTGGSAIESLRADRRTEVRRRAQEEAF